MSQSVDRALSILPLLAQGPAGLGQVADRLGVHKSTALRLLRALHGHGLVHRQSDQLCGCAHSGHARAYRRRCVPVRPNVVVPAEQLLELLPLVRRTAAVVSAECRGAEPVAPMLDGEPD